MISLNPRPPAGKEMKEPCNAPWANGACIGAGAHTISDARGSRGARTLLTGISHFLSNTCQECQDHDWVGKDWLLIHQLVTFL